MNNKIIRQIPVAEGTPKQYRQIITLMEQRGYDISESLRNISDESKITAILIDNDSKIISEIGTALLAAWCSFIRRPLNPEKFIKYFDQLITDPDVKFYEQLITERNESGIYMK